MNHRSLLDWTWVADFQAADEQSYFERSLGVSRALFFLKKTSEPCVSSSNLKLKDSPQPSCKRAAPHGV
jgi:hypothetical protein